MKIKYSLFLLLFFCISPVKAGYKLNVTNYTGKPIYIMSRDDKKHWNRKNKFRLEVGQTKKLWRLGKINGPLRFFYAGDNNGMVTFTWNDPSSPSYQKPYREGEKFYQYSGPLYKSHKMSVTPHVKIFRSDNEGWVNTRNFDSDNHQKPKFSYASSPNAKSTVGSFTIHRKPDSKLSSGKKTATW